MREKLLAWLLGLILIAAYVLIGWLIGKRTKRESWEPNGFWDISAIGMSWMTMALLVLAGALLIGLVVTGQIK